jgi:hypothetical protein
MPRRIFGHENALQPAQPFPVCTCRTGLHDILVALRQDSGSEAVMRVCVHDGLYELLTERAGGFQEFFAVFFGVAGVENNQDLVGFDDNLCRDQIAAEDIYAIHRVLDFRTFRPCCFG